MDDDNTHNTFSQEVVEVRQDFIGKIHLFFRGDAARPQRGKDGIIRTEPSSPGFALYQGWNHLFQGNFEWRMR